MEIIATKRETLGKKTKELRKNRQIPAVIYGSEIESTSLTINTLDFIRVYKDAGETTLVDVKYNGSNEKVLIKEVQVHPVSLNPIHVSFHKVDLTAKIHAHIPVEVINEEASPIVINGEGLVLTLLNEIEVEALPTDLPPHFEIDVSHLSEIGQAVTVGELNFDREKVEIVDLEDDALVVKIDYAEMAEEEEEEVELTEEELIEGMEVTGERAEGEEGEDGEVSESETKEEKPAEEGSNKPEEKAEKTEEKQK